MADLIGCWNEMTVVRPKAVILEIRETMLSDA
jgi:hypothetical protein